MESFGKKFKVTLFGGSHEEEVGVVLEGVKSGLALNGYDFDEDIARREAGVPGTTSRREADVPVFESGVAPYASGEGFVTTGEPLRISFTNRDFDDSVYEHFREAPRPGHADYPLLARDGKVPAGGGQASGRMTLPLVAAGVVAKKMLEGISFDAHLTEVGGCPNRIKWPALVEEAQREGDSLGGVVECVVDGLKPGLGMPFFDSVESLLSHALFSIPGVRGVEFGDGFAAARMKGSEHNDPLGPDGPLKNGSGGVNGGLTNGAPLLFRVAFKPTSSISRPQRTWNFRTESYEELIVRGRHDCCFALRTPPVVEAVAAVVLADIISVDDR